MKLDPNVLMTDIGAVMGKHGVPPQLRLGLLIGLAANALKSQGHSDDQVKTIVSKALDSALTAGGGG